MNKEKFRGPVGRRYTVGLFYETCESDKSTVLYTLKDEDHKGFPSIKRLYMEEDDLTEYVFANKYFENWAHWKEISESSWFKPYITLWREELDLRTRAKALNRIREEADHGGKNSFQANRYLIEKGYETTSSKRGRPTKADIQAEAKRQAENDRQVSADAERLGIQAN